MQGNAVIFEIHFVVFFQTRWRFGVLYYYSTPLVDFDSLGGFQTKNKLYFL